MARKNRNAVQGSGKRAARRGRTNANGVVRGDSRYDNRYDSKPRRSGGDYEDDQYGDVAERYASYNY